MNPARRRLPFAVASLLAPLVWATVAAAAPRLEVHAWDEALLPPIFTGPDSLAPTALPPDDLDDSARDVLDARPLGSRAVTLDGDLADWRLVRWQDIAGGRSVLQGSVAGDADVSLRFALQWSESGVWFAATVRDDSLAAADAPLAALECVTLSLASQSPLVQKAWLGGSRSLRVRADGAVEGWTDVRNRRREGFDAASLGVRAAVRRGEGAAPRLDVELFAPWTVFYPLLPGTPGRPLVNVRVDDFERGATKVIAWSTRRVGDAGRAQWGRLEWGDPGAVGRIVSAGLHADTVHEWLVVPPTNAKRAIRMRIAGLQSTPLSFEASVPATPYFIRVRDLPPAASWMAAKRVFDFEIDAGQPILGSRDRLTRTPTVSALRSQRQSIDLAPAVGDARFPNSADIAVRFDRAVREAEAIGEWRERRYHTTGVTAHRMAAWAEVDRWLTEAADLRPANAHPDRTASGVPMGKVVLRGYASDLDGSAQAYAIYIPAERRNPAPLVIALHGLDEDELSLFESTGLAAQARAHGFVVVCPFGRGNTAYRLAGERDVLDAVAAARGAVEIDAQRIYATGWGVGGTGTWSLALRHPGLLAAAAPVSAYGDFDHGDLFTRLAYQPAERAWFNAHNPLHLVRSRPTTAFRIAHGDRDPTVSPVHAHKMAARLTEVGATPEVQIDPTGGHGVQFFDAELSANFEFFARHTRAEVGVASPAFQGSGGPICDVFARGPFVIVYGTRGATAVDDSLAARELADEWRRRFAADARVIADHALPAPLAAGANLILVGTPSSNRWLSEWADRLHVRYDERRAVVNGVPWGLAEHGVVWAAVHPVEPTLSIVVLSGMRGRILGAQRSVVTIASDCAIAGPALGELRIDRLSTSR